MRIGLDAPIPTSPTLTSRVLKRAYVVRELQYFFISEEAEPDVNAKRLWDNAEAAFSVYRKEKQSYTKAFVTS
jgi:hypothetical protein